MNPGDVEHLRVAANQYVYHRNNHTLNAPEPECLYCDDRLIDARLEDGVVYMNERGD